MFIGFVVENIYLIKRVGVIFKWLLIILNVKIVWLRRKILKMFWLIEYRLIVG